MPEFFVESPPLSPADQRLVEAYEWIGRPSDDLPYSADFEKIVERLKAEGESRSHEELIRKLFSLRKRGQLPYSTGHSLRFGGVSDFDIRLAESLLKKRLVPFGSRDQLPYTYEFDAMHEEFNRDADAPLDKHKFWRLIARISK